MSGPTQEVAQIVACTTTTVILVTVLDMDLAIRAIDLDMVPDMVPGTPAMALATLATGLDTAPVTVPGIPAMDPDTDRVMGPDTPAITDGR